MVATLYDADNYVHLLCNLPPLFISLDKIKYNYANLWLRFVAVRKPHNFREASTLMDEICYDEVLRFVRQKHQVLMLYYYL